MIALLKTDQHKQSLSVTHPHPLRRETHATTALLLNEVQARWGIALRLVYIKVEALVFSVAFLLWMGLSFFTENSSYSLWR